MQPEMTPDEIANEIRSRQVYSRINGEGETFVMVEGKTDAVLWEEYRSREDCTLYPTHSKDKIIATLAILKRRKNLGVAGIVDADYWLLTDADELGTDNLLYDDCCPDMESILLRSPALKKVLRHTLDDVAIDEIHDLADELTQESLRLAMRFGYFRWLNHCQDYGLPCNQIRFDEAIDAATLKLDCQWVAKRLTEGGEEITSKELLSEVADLRAKRLPDTIQLCRGKDVLAIMAFILPRLYEKRFSEALPDSAMSLRKDGQLAKELRKAYEYMYFRDTALFASIEQWEDTNTPYRILKQAF